VTNTTGDVIFNISSYLIKAIYGKQIRIRSVKIEIDTIVILHFITSKSESPFVETLYLNDFFEGVDFTDPSFGIGEKFKFKKGETVPRLV